MVWVRAGITLAAVLATAFWQRDVAVKTNNSDDRSGLKDGQLLSPPQREIGSVHPGERPTRSSLLVEPAPKELALALASTAWIVPALMSRSTAPSPNHARILLWYKSLRQPPWKPPD